jgi:MFS transporter, DHA2 family, multidrug resistance protein
MTETARQYPAPSMRWIIAVTVMLVTVMEILDMTIVNVSLPNMMGQLGANSDQITWVLTSYIVSSAIIMPLTGFFVSRLGRKRYMIIMVAGFLFSSMLCGLSQNLTEIVIFRVLQGVFGASLVPMSQYTLQDTFPKEQIGIAMAIWGIGVMLAPAFGPTIGGYITNHLGWRWVFYINAPVCLIAMVMIMRFISETPRNKSKSNDWVGMALMAIGVASLQIFLDRGNTNGWFQSQSIQVLFATCLICLITFIIRGLRKKDNIINLQLFKNRNFSIATGLLTVFTMSIIALLSVQPLMLEHLMGYTAQLAGLAMMPRGIAAALGMIIVAKTINRIDGRWLVTAGIGLTAYGTYLMAHLSQSASFYVIGWEGAIQGVGMGLFFVPVSGFSLSEFRDNNAAEAAGLFSFGRSIGSSIGISLISTIITQETQINWNRLGGHLTSTSHATQQWINTQSQHLPHAQVMSQLASTLDSQASMVAFMDAFWFAFLLLIAMLPFVWMLKKASISMDAGH